MKITDLSYWEEVPRACSTIRGGLVDIEVDISVTKSKVVKTQKNPIVITRTIEANENASFNVVQSTEPGLSTITISSSSPISLQVLSTSENVTVE